MAGKSKKKTETAQAAEAVVALSDMTASAGVAEIDEGLETMAAAAETGKVGRQVMRDATRKLVEGESAQRSAQNLAAISAVMAEAGVEDMAQGVALLTASDDIAIQSAVIGGLSEDDLALGMELAAIGGQLQAVGDVVLDLDMPLLAAFLGSLGDRMRQLSADTIHRFGATRALARALAETGEAVGDLGSNEVGEGLMRMEAAEEAAVLSDVADEVGRDLRSEGRAEMAAARDIR
ncbi:MAG TPA: hypothetical protein P5148_09725, partial [Anaerolineae bacterium]|nr:hypothetical protein [Anaerolineae bacterium]